MHNYGGLTESVLSFRSDEWECLRVFGNLMTFVGFLGNYKHFY